MGTTTSRPILHGVESALLQVARLIDTVVRTIEHLLSSLFSILLPSTLYHDFPSTGEKIKLRTHNEKGMLHDPAARFKHNVDWKKKREERLKRRKLRAEWAAAGLDVIEMEKQELAKKNRQQPDPQLRRTTTPTGSIAIVDEKKKAEAMLGPVPQAPAARPEAERETRAEKDRGKLWVMSNIAPKTVAQQPFTVSKEHGNHRMPTRPDKNVALESVRETSHNERREYAVHGHGHRIASGGSEHADISYQIVATSRNGQEDHSPVKSNAPRPKSSTKSITPQGIVSPVGRAITSATTASRIHTQTQASSRPTHKPHSSSSPTYTPMPTKATENETGPTLSQPTLIQPIAKRLQRSLDSCASHPKTDESSHLVLGPTRRETIRSRMEPPRACNQARRSLDAAYIAPRSSTPTTPTLPVFSSSSSDAESISSRRSLFDAGLCRSSTPPCVVTLADRACKSRWEANAKERKVWKAEVNRITLQKLNQTSKRHHDTQEKVTASSVYDLRLHPTMSAASKSTNPAYVADRNLRRASLEQTNTGKACKVRRTSSRKL
ncbi:hypothetical protein CBS101457_006220 [Exobasidium rhododendri]|nr:hypothetical protein CBS101457_006220 [Exobasidium rhododendri]